ncbi:ATP-dependent DNA helicase PIF1 [Collichthys lucidus]|uniref:ATP-dependent DNA helicase n=1 Tax=Collichthys lucidus TaxID=240159 RepID=A0A4V6ALS0_COLLU|nr:ATP-dependent DNA helicase PIF1 [Collichthys lucidus]
MDSALCVNEAPPLYLYISGPQMPRGKSYRRSQAAKRRVERQETRRLDLNPVPSVPSVHGTGRRHRVRDEERGWERSQLTLKPHKLVVPAAHPTKKFVLLVGDSHLRALVDGFVAMPEGPLAFGFMSTPGATVAQLRTELVAAVLPRDPDAVVLLAPSNNLMACQCLEHSAADFASLLRCARSRWGNVAVLDFPPRLGRAEEQRSQELLRMAYNSTHLNDNVGMPILAYPLWQAAVRQLAEPEAEPPATPVPSSPYRPRFATQVVVVGEERQPRPEANPDGWLTIVKGQKVELKECFIPLTPVRFSPSILALVEKTSPSVLPSPQETTSAPVQVDTVVSHGAVSRDPKPVTPVPVAQEVECVDVEVCFLASPTSAVPMTAMDEDEATQGVVDLTLEPGPRSVVVTTRVGDEPPPGLPQLSPTPGVNAVADGPGFPQLSPTPGVDAVVDGPGQRTDSAIKYVGSPHSLVEKCVQGSFHQGNPVLHNPGVQCMAVALVSFAKHSVHSVFQWERKDLDTVVFLGDDLYSFLCGSNTDGDSRVAPGVGQGELSDAGVGMSLRKGLEYMLGKYSTCFLTLASSTCAVICEHGRYAIVDSHARNACGMVDVGGKSVVVHLASLEDLCSYVGHLSVSLGAEHRPFEIAAVSVTIPVTDDHTSECLSDHVVCVDSTESASGVDSSSFKRKRSAVSVTIPVTDDDISECLSDHVVCVDGTESASWVDGSTLRRNRSDVNFTSKKRKSSDTTGVNADVEFICDVSSKGLQFDPIDLKVAQALCKQLNVDFEKQNREMCLSAGTLGTPCLSDTIVADGNCFFRAVAQAVSDQYLDASRMRYVGSWATEMEIQATADFLGVNVYTYYNDRWLVYSCQNNAISKQGIYLQHVSGCHYEVVVCVNQPQLQTCYGLCKGDTDHLRGKRQRAVRNVMQSPEPKKSKITDCVSDCCVDGPCISTAITDFNTQDVVMDDMVTCKYQPLRYNMSRDLCEMLNIDLVKPFKNEGDVHGSAGNLCKTEKVVDDGSSFFRAVCHAISGSQKAHRKLRLFVVKYMHDNNDIHMQLIGEAYNTVAEYTENVKMKYVGTCISKVEIRATASALGVDVFIFSAGKWMGYFPKTKKQTGEAIYLSKCGENNFEAVSCVQDGVKNSCFELCKDVKVDTQYMAKRPCKQDESKTSSVKSNINYCFSKYFKTKKHAQNRIKYQSNVLLREKIKQLSKTKYKVDDVHREKIQQLSKTKYKVDDVHREKIKQLSKTKYKVDDVHREKIKHLSKTKYKDDMYREKMINQYKRKYKQDDLYREKMIKQYKRKYKQDDLYREKAKIIYKQKYHKELLYQNKAKERSQSKYRVNLTHKHNIKVRSAKTYHGNVEFRKRVSAGVRNKRQQIKAQAQDFNFVMQRFVDKVKDGPDFVCCVCHRLLFRHQVLQCRKEYYRQKAGGQNGVHGPVTCVPANIVQTTNLLPRTSMDGSLLPIKLKRKLTYKGHYEYEYVDTTHIKQALQYLKDNIYYKDVHFNTEWLNEFCKDDEINPDVQQDQTGSVEPSSVPDDEFLHDRQQHCMFQDTCLMPVDIGQEALDQYFDDILNLAPAEGNCPVKLLTDHANEARCFPVLFPKGCPTYHDARQHRLTLSRYFNNRILHADGRFAQNVEYIFFAQYMSELEQVVSNVSIALRKGKGKGRNHKVSCETFNTEPSLRELLQFDDGYRFLKPIRGTPAFWQGAQRDLLACVRQLGIPTWFCSFSAADMRWKNLLSSILKQAGRTDTVEQLEWADRCELLRRNPVTAARMFDFRWHCFLREVLMSPANPIGKIKDYFYRVEFQQRGSPHVHCLFWIENAPIIDKNTDAEVIQFIDRYVTCELPSNDEELLDTVTSVQQHSKRHAKTCKKGKTVCRFNFPRPPSARTFISRSLTHEDSCASKLTEGQSACNCKGKTPLMKKEDAADIMSKIKAAVRDDSLNFETAEQLFRHVGVSQGRFEAAYDRCATKTQVVLERQANAVWINRYSKPLLKCWNANIDIQFVVDAYACVVYIISYISKAEKEMGLLLQCAQREAAKEGNKDAKESLKNLGSVYLHNRDVCAQEAVYRLTNTHLKECSRKVVFVPVGEQTVRMSLPLKMLQQKSSSPNFSADDMWMLNIVDRYRNRPTSAVFRDMCLASFASQYRVLSKNETAVNRIQLGNKCGYVLKRTRTQPAVVRYVRFSETKNPELFYQSILQLFMPYYAKEQLKPVGFVTFQDFYLNGQVICGDNLMHSVKSVVDRNRSAFEVESEQLDNVEELINNDGIADDAWCQLCPEQELDRLECREIRREETQATDEPLEDIPDLAVQREQTAHLEKRNTTMCRSDGLALLCSLNETQMGIFYQVRQWCVQQAQGQKPDPFHIFVTGGAGTGKSHLIKAIQYEATRVLAPVCHQPDDICVLLTAPTGIAAYSLNATTIHSTFSIGKDVRLPYTPLVLNTIVRQKDQQFAKLLNRVRTHSKGTAMLGCDLQLLKSRETGEDSSAVHIFPTNRQVREHNLEQIMKTCPDYVCISAQDYINSSKTGKLVLLKGHHSNARNTCLEEDLLLGKISEIVYADNENKFPRKVYVKFDNADVGKLWRKCCAHPPGVDSASVGIDAEEERVTDKGGMRRQFPLKLAWACTVHKVQGLTVDEAVVSLDRVFQPGQAYVAISRVRSPSGLILKDFKEKAIYCKDSIKEALNSMSPFLIDNIQTYKCGTNAFSVFLMNVHGLDCHVKDLTSCIQHLKPQCVAVTETWLSDSPSVVTIDGYHFHSVPRNESYSDHRLLGIKAQQHGGVGMYTSDNLVFDIIQVTSVNIECLIYNFTGNRMLVAVVYRPPSYPMSLFRKNLGKLLDYVEPLSDSVTVMGDFNENVVATKSICNFMTQRGYVQHISEATTAKGTLIDHVYVKTTHFDVSCVVLQTYFSDHDAIICEFTRGTDDNVVNM